MSYRSDIVKRIQKQDEIILDLRIHADEIHNEIAVHVGIAEELKSILKTLPPDDESEQQAVDPVLRQGSDVAKAREHLHVIGKPTHVDDLLKLLGRPIDKKSRASLSGQMSLYARKNQIFTRPGPNIFGLREWLENGSGKIEPTMQSDGEALPLPEHTLTALPLQIDDDEDFPLIPVDEPEAEAIDKTH